MISIVLLLPLLLRGFFYFPFDELVVVLQIPKRVADLIFLGLLDGVAHTCRPHLATGKILGELIGVVKVVQTLPHYLHVLSILMDLVTNIGGRFVFRVVVYDTFLLRIVDRGIPS